MYEIKARQRRNAKKLNVEIKPSTNKKKKIDIYNANNKKIASIGSSSYNDYASYIETKGKDYADKRKKAYKARHEKTRKIIGSNSYWADQLLWN
jgi:hypothetical protein